MSFPSVHMEVGSSDAAVLEMNGKKLRVTRTQANDLTTLEAICIYFGTGPEQARDWAEYLNNKFNRVGSP
jgi:hypothetical protein